MTERPATLSPRPSAGPQRKAPGFAVLTMLSAQMVADCLCAALAGGSGYWCQVQRAMAPRRALTFRFREERVYPQIDYPMNGGSLILMDTTAGEDAQVKPAYYRLTRAALRRGLGLMAAHHPHHFASVVAETGDSETGDVLLQLSVLGEVRYG